MNVSKHISKLDLYVYDYVRKIKCSDIIYTGDYNYYSFNLVFN